MTSASCLNNPELRALDETHAVTVSQGIDLDCEEAIQGMGAISEPGGTGDSKSSLCIDILNPRPSEVDYIYESVITLGRERNIPTSTLETRASFVKGIESHYVGRNDETV